MIDFLIREIGDVYNKRAGGVHSVIEQLMDVEAASVLMASGQSQTTIHRKSPGSPMARIPRKPAGHYYG